MIIKTPKTPAPFTGVYEPGFVILSLETIFPRWNGLDEQITETMVEKIAHALIDKKLPADKSEIRTEVGRSQAAGLPGTAGPAQKWNLHHADIHAKTYRAVLERHVTPHFKAKTVPHSENFKTLRSKMETASSMGVKFGIVSDCDDNWAEVIPQYMNIAPVAQCRKGIEATKGQPRSNDEPLLIDFLKKAQYYRTYQSVVAVDHRPSHLRASADLGCSAAWIRAGNTGDWQGKPAQAVEFSDVFACLDAVIAARSRVMRANPLRRAV